MRATASSAESGRPSNLRGRGGPARGTATFLCNSRERRPIPYDMRGGACLVVSRADINNIAIGSMSPPGQVPIIYLRSGQTYTLRPIGDIHSYWQTWHNGKPLIVRADLVDEWRQSGYQVKRRCASHVIDKADNRLKILAFGTSVYNQFAKAENPSTGYWSISAVGDGMNKRYSATYLGGSAWTTGEQATYENGQVDLREVVRAP